jgi:hypothetical protein
MNTDLENYLNNLCCRIIPVITISNGVLDGRYTNLDSAIAWLQQYTTASITNASLVDDVFTFTVPAGSDFSLVDGFMYGATGNYEDKNGLVTKYGNLIFENASGNNIFGDAVFGNECFFYSSCNNILGNCTFGNYAFYGNEGSNTLGNCTFGHNAFADSVGDNNLGNCTFDVNAFKNSSGSNTLGNCTFGEFSFNLAAGNNTINNILLSENTIEFARYYKGTMNIRGNIGTTESADYNKFFLNPFYSNIIINALASKETSNAGGIEGDLQSAINNNITVNFNL